MSNSRTEAIRMNMKPMSSGQLWNSCISSSDLVWPLWRNCSNWTSQRLSNHPCGILMAYISVSALSQVGQNDQTEQCCMKSNAPNEVLAFASPVLLMTHWLILAPAVYPSICCFSEVYLPFYQHYPLDLLTQLPSAALQLTPKSF